MKRLEEKSVRLGGWWIRKSDKSRGKQNKNWRVFLRKWKSPIISICRSCTSPNKYVVCVLSRLSPRQMFFTAVCNYTNLIVVIIKWLILSFIFSVSLSSFVALDVLIWMLLWHRPFLLEKLCQVAVNSGNMSLQQLQMICLTFRSPLSLDFLTLCPFSL